MLCTIALCWIPDHSHELRICCELLVQGSLPGLESIGVCNNILPRYGNMDLHIMCKVYARYESCKECYYTNSHRCQSNYRVNVATIVHVALASLCSYCCNMNNILLQTLESILSIVRNPFSFVRCVSSRGWHVFSQAAFLKQALDVGVWPRI
jgi:hypothetical protein